MGPWAHPHWAAPERERRVVWSGGRKQVPLALGWVIRTRAGSLSEMLVGATGTLSRKRGAGTHFRSWQTPCIRLALETALERRKGLVATGWGRWRARKQPPPAICCFSESVSFNEMMLFILKNHQENASVSINSFYPFDQTEVYWENSEPLKHKAHEMYKGCRGRGYLSEAETSSLTHFP